MMPSAIRRGPGSSNAVGGHVGGHEQLAAIPNTMRGMFRHTAHMMMNHLVEVDGDEATGELLCTARHLSKDAQEATALNVIIRYVDRYERLEGTWKIADRKIRFLWSERQAVVESGFGRSRGRARHGHETRSGRATHHPGRGCRDRRTPSGR
jgi:hypothetical protein